MRQIIVGLSLASLAAVSPAWADLSNGDFSLPLAGSWITIGSVGIQDGQAVIENTGGFSSLGQEFLIPDESISLSFSYLAEFGPGGADTFSVSLLDPSTFMPLIATDPNPADPEATYFFLDDSAIGALYDSSFVSLANLAGGWRQVTFDLTGLNGIGLPGFLAFDLIGLDASVYSQVRVDDVSIRTGGMVVPAPGAFVLALIGLAGLRTVAGRKKTDPESVSAAV